MPKDEFEIPHTEHKPAACAQVSLVDYANVRELSRDVGSLDDRDINIAEELLLGSLKSICKEKAISSP